MTILRPATGRRHPPELRTLKAPTTTIAAEADWQPEILSLSRFRDEAEVQLVNRIHARVAALLGRSVEAMSPEAMRGMVAEHFSTALDEEHASINRTDRLRLQDAVFSEIVGYGPIQDLLHDDTISAIIPPLSLVGPVLTVRKFRRVPLSPDDLIRHASISPEALQFLRTCVRGRLNVIVSGGSGAGKTTLLNALSSYISTRDRIVTIE